MASSRAWSIILELQQKLMTIRVANGYLTDVGTNVWVTDRQRSAEDALGLMIYTDSIEGPGIKTERPSAPVRELTLILEAATSTLTLDDAQEQIHAVIEDVDACVESWAKEFPGDRRRPPVLLGADVLDRPEGSSVVAMQARVLVRYFR